MSNRHQNKRKKEREAKRIERDSQLVTALQNRRETALMLNYQPVNCPDDVWRIRAVRFKCQT